MAKRKNKGSSEGITAKGFFRLNILNPDGKVVGDTGWKKNQVVNLGFQDYLCKTMAGSTGSKVITYGIIGTGTAPGAAATSLNGEITDAAANRCAVTPTIIASKTVQFAFSLASNVCTEAKTIQNVALINHSSTATAGTIFCGNTYVTSALATNQSIAASYQIRFS